MYVKKKSKIIIFMNHKNLLSFIRRDDRLVEIPPQGREKWPERED